MGESRNKPASGPPPELVGQAIREHKNTFQELRERAADVERLYVECGIRLSPYSGLSNMLAKAKALSDDGGSTYADVLYALHVNRLADAVLPLRPYEAKRAKYLRRLTRGSLDFFDRKESEAKNILWELETWQMLRQRGAAAMLLDPPDIVVELPAGQLGIACKKIYSENKVEKALSVGSRQVKDFDAGAVVLNLDELVPGGTFVVAKDQTGVDQLLQPICDTFRANHERRFTKYLGAGRIVCAAMIVTTVGEITTKAPRFNNLTSALFWGGRPQSATKQRMAEEFRNLVVGHQSGEQ